MRPELLTVRKSGDHDEVGTMALTWVFVRTFVVFAVVALLTDSPLVTGIASIATALASLHDWAQAIEGPKTVRRKV